MMANDRIPNDPYRSPDDAYRPTGAGDELRNPAHLDRNPAQLDNELQPDLELAEGPASGGRIAMFAIAAAVVLGAVFYGLNNTSVEKAGTSPVAQTSAPAPTTSTAQNTAKPATAPAGMRDVTPKANTEPGMTTGAAPARPQTPPSSAPTGQDANRSASPPTGGASTTR